MGNHGRRHRGTVPYCIIPYYYALGLGAIAQNGMVGGVSLGGLRAGRPGLLTPKCGLYGVLRNGVFYFQRVRRESRCYYSGEHQPASRSDSITRISRQSLENAFPIDQWNHIPRGSFPVEGFWSAQIQFRARRPLGELRHIAFSFLGEGQMVLSFRV